MIFVSLRRDAILPADAANADAFRSAKSGRSPPGCTQPPSSNSVSAICNPLRFVLPWRERDLINNHLGKQSNFRCKKNVDTRRTFNEYGRNGASGFHCWMVINNQIGQKSNGTSNMKRLLLKAMVAGFGIMLASSAVVRGGILYNNSSTLVNPFMVMNFTNNAQIGDQIWLGSGATPQYLTYFSFEYYDPYNSSTWPSGQAYIQADIRLYMNDGTPFNGYNTPGTLFYESGFVNIPSTWVISGTNAATIQFTTSDLFNPSGSGSVMALNPNFALPTNFTFSVTFSGLLGTDSVGLPSFYPPTVGGNTPDYWYNNPDSGNWELLTNSLGPVGFGARFVGSPTPTPEPTVLCLGALGAAAIVVITRRRRRV